MFQRQQDRLKGKTDGECPYASLFFHIPTTVRTEPGKSETPSRFALGWQGPKYLGHHIGGPQRYFVITLDWRQSGLDSNLAVLCGMWLFQAVTQCAIAPSPQLHFYLIKKILNIYTHWKLFFLLLHFILGNYIMNNM